MNPGSRLGTAPARHRPGAAKVAIAVAAAVLAGLGAGSAMHLLLGPAAPTASSSASSVGLHGQATWAPGARPAPPISGLRDQSGALFSLGSLRGRTVAMTFFDSHCTQACPLEGRALAAAERAIPAGQRPVLVVVSVNPLDSAASARAAARAWGLATVAPWHWLMGRQRELAAAWRAYHIFVAAPRNGDVAHTEALYLIDRHGYERSGYVYPFLPRFVALDLRSLSMPRVGERAGG